MPPPSYPEPPKDAGEILERSRKIAPWLREQSERIEQGRRLPDDVVAALKDTGVFRMAFPSSWDGPGLDSYQQTEVVEALSYGDPSAGWCAMIGMDSGIYSGYLEESAAREMFADMDQVTAGLILPAGRAERVEGGFRLTGRWRFGSGVTHAEWVVGGALVHRDGEPEPGPTGGPKHWRLMYMPADQVEIVDTWDTTGLAGSGSCDYLVDDLFVPAERTFSFSSPRSADGPIGAPDAVVRNMPGVPLGMMRAALDHFRDLALSKTIPISGQRWADTYRMQKALGEMEMEYAAVRHAVYNQLRTQWERLEQVGEFAELTHHERIEGPLLRLYAFRTAREVITRIYDLLASSAIYRPNPVDRWLRDITTMCQHIVVQDPIIQSAGAFLLGAEPEFPYILGIVD
ncbi:acyl-CoA dehydrogenase family protein [Glycomyces xiaoerkulensis]|uniref:acyl-CoA dehydrogenase family protein n=1 Tax=Glycomyces xiaoerkulensis TaxID=2038139 RepID=UPI000C2630C7|nr:acyl-CoA dehydrogenase family protein [Glycomyces xiaoerkulensis]